MKKILTPAEFHASGRRWWRGFVYYSIGLQHIECQVDGIPAFSEEEAKQRAIAHWRRTTHIEDMPDRVRVEEQPEAPHGIIV